MDGPPLRRAQRWSTIFARSKATKRTIHKTPSIRLHHSDRGPSTSSPSLNTEKSQLPITSRTRRQRRSAPGPSEAIRRTPFSAYCEMKGRHTWMAHLCDERSGGAQSLHGPKRRSGLFTKPLLFDFTTRTVVRVHLPLHLIQKNLNFLSPPEHDASEGARPDRLKQ